MSIPKKLILEFDDFHWKSPENCLDTIEKYVEAIPNIKINLFTSPKHTNLPIESNKLWCKRVKELINLGNIKLAVHGLTHSYIECSRLSLEETIKLLDDAQIYFNRAGLEFTRVFRAPNWHINENTHNALVNKNYTHIYSHTDFKHLTHPRIKTIFYNWNLKDDFNCNDEVIIAHGHTFNTCGNGIVETFDKVINFIKTFEPEFLYVDNI